MISNDDLKAIFERITARQEAEGDKLTLRSLLPAGNGDNEIQVCKNIVNITEGRDIHISDALSEPFHERIYQGVDAEAIKEAL